MNPARVFLTAVCVIILTPGAASATKNDNPTTTIETVDPGEPAPCEGTDKNQPECLPASTTIPAEPDGTFDPGAKNEGTCPEGQYPQSYAPDAPCGPDDPCVGVNPDTGEGTTLWHLQQCFISIGDPPSTTTTVPPSLPATGFPTGWVLLAAGLAVAVGVGATGLARRDDDRG